MIFLRPKSPPVFVIGLDQQQTGKFAVSAGRRLECHPVHPGNLTQQSLRQLQRTQASLNAALRLERMYLRKSGQRG